MGNMSRKEAVHLLKQAEVREFEVRMSHTEYTRQLMDRITGHEATIAELQAAESAAYRRGVEAGIGMVRAEQAKGQDDNGEWLHPPWHVDACCDRAAALAALDDETKEDTDEG